MTKKDLIKRINFIMGEFKNMHPGEIIMLPTLMSAYENNKELSDKYFGMFIELLKQNEYLTQNDKIEIGLTEHGFVYLHENKPVQLNIDISKCIARGKNRKTCFYNIWDIIGTDTEGLNPFYIKGSDYYNTIKPFIQGIPPTVNQYLADIKENEKRNKSRIEWYWDLFSLLDDSQIKPFLDKLSALINERNHTPIQKSNLELDDMDDLSEAVEALEITNDNVTMQEFQKQKTPKVFVSHKHADEEYAKALVELMLKLGVKENQIFCSSYPGLGIPLGKNIFDYIKELYESHNLLVLFIHSPRYYHSPVSLNEMGAAWVLRYKYVSFLTSDCEFDMLNGVITKHETAFKAGQKDTYHYLNDFKIILEETFNLAPKDVTRWETIKNDFLKVVENITYE